MSYQIEKHEVFGVVTDFLIESKSIGGTVTVSVSCIMPAVRYDRERKVLCVYPPENQIESALAASKQE